MTKRWIIFICVYVSVTDNQVPGKQSWGKAMRSRSLGTIKSSLTPLPSAPPPAWTRQAKSSVVKETSPQGKHRVGVVQVEELHLQTGTHLCWESLPLMEHVYSSCEGRSTASCQPTSPLSCRPAACWKREAIGCAILPGPAGCALEFHCCWEPNW